MARAAKSAVVLCMDVGLAMSHSNQGKESPFEQAKKVMMLFLQRQVFAESKDEIAVVLYGTDTTDNALAREDQYENISVHRHLMLPDFDLLEQIENVVEPGSVQADFLDALIVSMDLLQKETLGKKYTRLHIAVFSDLSSPFSVDQLEVIIANLKKAEITLQFFLPFSVDEEEFGGSSNNRGNAGSSDRGCGPGKGLSDQQKEGIEMVRKIMFSLDGEEGLSEVFTFRDSLERLSIFKKIERRPMPWPCQLTVGSSLSIRIVGYKSVTEEKVKKTWTHIDAKTHKKEDIKKETVYCLNNDEETEVEKDDTIQGFRYGSDIVPFSKVDQEQMKYKSEGKCFAVLGFTKSSMVLSNQFVGNQVIRMFAPSDDEAASVALSALIHALDEMDMVAIVRYVYDRRSNPQVGVAFPHIKDKYECLVYVQLPFMEDIRQYLFSSLKNNKKFTPTESQNSAIDSLIDSMSLIYDDGETKEDLFKTSKLPNPQFQRLFQCLQHKALNPESPLPPIDQHLLDMLETPVEVKEACMAPLATVKACFPLQEATKRKEVKTADEIFTKKTDEPDAKKLKEDDEGFSLLRLADGNVTSVGSVNPDQDFQALLRQKNTDFKHVSDQLIKRIYECLDVKQTQYYMKSILCIKTFREEAIKLSQVRLFNDFLQLLKQKVDGSALMEFWDIIVQEEISLITSSESKGSSVTPEEAKQFLAQKEEKVEEAAMMEDEGDVDDLLDMM
ncbi:X-ray repair complementing defective repair in Chinese hamster cells 5 [Xenopus laevis]|uniref:DNA repair protein Ku80 n=1 Tax=Xenopus laevis TaxID=8355 RepID=XRCC5_XENLA|nr:X-ray repair complementing defective repair in Chinese hamster cells 5 [Xenopus laevis]AAH77439.1 Xrcc5-A-prov protein [Xenopus laevis]